LKVIDLSKNYIRESFLIRLLLFLTLNSNISRKKYFKGLKEFNFTLMAFIFKKKVIFLKDIKNK